RVGDAGAGRGRAQARASAHRVLARRRLRVVRARAQRRRARAGAGRKLKRRQFISGCAVAPLASWSTAWAQGTPHAYSRTRLVDVNGRPLRATVLEPETNYVFQYPFAATPCLLLKLQRPVTNNASLKREDGSTYAWQGGVGPERNLVAFSA